jgi:NTE family protein
MAGRRGGASARTAFVLGGGASLGAMQAGMLRALYERGIAADLFVGASVGALNAAFVASRPQTPETADELAAVWTSLRREDLFPISPWALANGLLSRRGHLVEAGHLRATVRRYLQIEDLTDAAIALHVLAFDLNSGQEVLLSDGPAVDALAAAAAVPGILPPVRLGERRLVDGGVVNNNPISHAIALGAKRIYLLPTRSPAAFPLRDRRGAIGAGVDGLSLVTNSRLEADLVRYRDDAELIVLPAPNPLQVRPIDFSHPGRLISDALDAARRRLAEDGGQAQLLRAS